MNIVILDVETTGDNHLIDEISQISYIVLDSELNIIKAKNFFFMVDYVYFKSNKKKLDIEELKRLSNNKTFKDRYDEIFNDLNDNLIVCHKCEHDINYLKSEFMRVDKDNSFRYEEFCTMKYYTDILKIPSTNYGYKYPKLIEIMPYLNIKRGDINNYSKSIFNLSDSEIILHDSRVDVVVTYLITIKTEEIVNKYKALIEHKHMKIDEKYDDKSSIKVDYSEQINLNKKNNITEDRQYINYNSNNYENVNEKENTCISNIFSLQGYISKKDYRKFIFLMIPIYLLSLILINEIYLNSEMDYSTQKGTMVVVSYIFKFPLLILSIKRIRGLKKSMWLIILLFIPIINTFFVLDLCLEKDVKYIEECKIAKNKKITWYTVISVTILLIIGGYLYYRIYESNKVDEAINMVENALYYDDESLFGSPISSYIESRMNDIDPYYVDGWYGYKIEKDVYLVCYDFDMEDEDYENGYISYPFEINIETKELTPIVLGDMIHKYEELGYFNDIEINAFKYENDIPFKEYMEFKVR